jgi:hypothetical protein
MQSTTGAKIVRPAAHLHVPWVDKDNRSNLMRRTTKNTIWAERHRQQEVQRKSGAAHAEKRSGATQPGPRSEKGEMVAAEAKHTNANASTVKRNRLELRHTTNYNSERQKKTNRCHRKHTHSAYPNETQPIRTHHNFILLTSKHSVHTTHRCIRAPHTPHMDESQRINRLAEI